MPYSAGMVGEIIYYLIAANGSSWHILCLIDYSILNGACELEIIFFAASEQKVYSQMIQAGNRLWPAFLNTILKVIALLVFCANANEMSACPSPTLLM